MTTLVRIAVAALLAIFSSSCAFDINLGEGKKGNGEIAEESRKITEAFTEVYASEGLDVFVTQDDEFSIRVEADDNIIDLIGTDIGNGRLKVHCVENIGRATKNIYVSLPNIDALKTSSGADLVAQNTLHVSTITLDASSGSDLEVEVEATEVIAKTSSGADIAIAGTAESLSADASSGSDIKARKLVTKECRAEASSGADISVHVSESLTAHASSGADIFYSGDAEVEKRKSSSGGVHKD